MRDAGGMPFYEYIDFARSCLNEAILAIELQQEEWLNEGFMFTSLRAQGLTETDCCECMKSALGDFLRAHPDAFISHDFSGDLILRYKSARTAEAARALKCCRKEHK